jgi:hypothetical protein
LEATRRHEVFQPVNFAGITRRAAVLVGFCLANTAEKVPLHTDVGCEFTRHRVVTLESQEPRNNQDPILVFAVPNLNPIFLRLPILK